MAVSRKQIANAFRKAKERLKNDYMCGGGAYICLALQHTKADQRARYIVQTRMCHAPTLEEWLIERGFRSGAEDEARVYRYRQRWLNKLIEEFSA